MVKKKQVLKKRNQKQQLAVEEQLLGGRLEEL
jgi:hypothetical protein